MKIRNYKKEDDKKIMRVYQKAFTGFPWFENLSNEEVKRRWNEHKTKQGFRCLVVEERNRIVGATWWDTPTLEELRLERGDKLADFVQKKASKFIVWIRETCVDPVFQGREIGKKLKYRALEEIRRSKLHWIILTRLRDDNSPITRLNSLLGFQRTGIRMLSSQKNNIFHEYWYLDVGKEKRYVISEDIHILLAKWAKKKGFILPSKKFFEELRKEMKEYLEKIFGLGNVDMVSAAELRSGIRKLIRQMRFPAVSMDRVYIKTKPEIQVARVVDDTLNDCGIGPRFGKPPIREQLLNIKRKFKKIVLIVDDVLFSGKVMVEIIESLEKMGVKVPLVVVGIAVGEGEKRVKDRTKAKILSVRYYKEVIDEICERDFYPGTPLSGRLVIGSKIETGAPYLLPFGKPFEWASIPKEKEREFSVFCLNRAIKLWEATEKASNNRIIRCCDLERVPLGISYSKKRFVSELKKRRANLLFLFLKRFYNWF